YVPDVAIRKCSAGTSAGRTASHRECNCEPDDVRQLPHYGLQPHFRYRTPDPTLGTGNLRDEAAVEPAGWCLHGAGARGTTARVSHHARPNQVAHRERNGC